MDRKKWGVKWEVIVNQNDPMRSGAILNPFKAKSLLVKKKISS